MNNYLNKRLSDLIITIPIFFVGSIIIIYLFYLDIQINHRSVFESFRALLFGSSIIFAAIYLWLKAVIEDFIRIGRHINLTMPAEVFLIAALEWALMWMANDLLYKPSLVATSSIKSFLLFDHPIMFWIIFDILILIVFRLIINYKKINFSSPNFSEDKNYEGRLLKRNFFSLISFFVIVIISIFL